MPYTITIEETKENVPFKDKEYKKVGVDADGEPTYDYVYFDSTQNITTKVYEQTVDNLQVSSVVAVINQNNRGE